MAPDGDAALLRRMAAGDESALGTLYDRWADRVHTLAFWILHDRDDAEDVVEETFWQAWRQASRYDAARASGLSWLVMIARSRALDRLRALRRRERWVSSTGALPAENEAAGAVPAQPLPEDRRARLSEALGSLPREQREVVELAFFGGLSHSEIAARTDQPLGTVKTRIRLAMEKLRQRLAPLRDEVV
jgi:RNA polymerase sigma-70 factor (ECF subfamily)